MTFRHGTLILLLGLALAGGNIACGDDDDDDKDAGSEGDGDSGDGDSGDGDSGDGDTGDGDSGDGDSGGGMTCGGTECEPIPPNATGMGATHCCTDDDKCGAMSQLDMKCYPRDQPGGRDLACPDQTVGEEGDPTGFGPITLTGCCGPTGCGVNGGPGLGCIPRDQLGEDKVDCEYSEKNNCSEILDLPCDGPEDCGDGETCCATFSITSDGYTAFACTKAEECMEMTTFPLCHDDSHCADGAQCLTSMYLPETLTRCYTSGSAPDESVTSEAGEVNCGNSLCGSGEKCCLRPPGEPYCAPEGENCRCVDADDEDAGM